MFRDHSGLHLLLLAIALTTSARADVLDVGGPRPDFPGIQEAVLAALDGDVIRVWPGTYEPFWINDLDVDVVNAGGGDVLVVGTVRIRNLSAGKEVTLAGLDARGVDSYGLVVSDCSGSIRIRDGVFEGGDATSSWSGAFPGVLVRACEDVVLIDTQSIGGPTQTGENGSPGATGLHCQGSELALFGCICRGQAGSADDDPGAWGYPGGHGALADGASRLWIAGSTLRGGAGGWADPDPSVWTGEYGNGGDGGWGYSGPPATWFQDNVYLPGAAGISFGGSNGVAGAAHSPGHLVPGAARFVRMDPLTEEGAVIALEFEGEPGELVLFRPTSGLAHAFDAVAGPLLIAGQPGSSGIAWRAAGVLDGTGHLSRAYHTPALAAFAHLRLDVQANFRAGPACYGAPTWSVVLDGAY